MPPPPDPPARAGAPPPAAPELLDAAVELAHLAGEVTRRWFRSADLAVAAKGDGTPVTEADREAEALVRRELAARFPDDAVLGEEHGAQAGTSGRRWFVDPIDGTKAFVRGVPLYATLLAVEDDFGPAAGVIHLPALGETVAAARGRGCTCDGRPARVSSHGALSGALLTASGFDYWDEAVLLGVKRAGCVLRTWGDGYGYALVATGRAEAMVDPVAAPWDLAPVAVVIAEAGGAFSDLGGVARTDGGSGVATNGHVHAELLACLAGGGAPGKR